MAGKLTPAGEEWLLAIAEMSDADMTGPVRIGELALKLGAAPSSASRMARLLASWGYVDFRRYGYILLTENGREEGRYLIRRRAVVGAFLAKFTCRLPDECAAEAKAVEYGFSRESISAMEKYLTDAAE